MYLGLLFILISVAVYLGNPLSLILIPVFVGYMNRFQIEAEEQVMRQKFGDDYRDYCAEVRDLITFSALIPKQVLPAIYEMMQSCSLQSLPSYRLTVRL